jgi:Na+/H+ antiporter NhaD/arsenite permease-like protein
VKSAFEQAWPAFALVAPRSSSTTFPPQSSSRRTRRRIRALLLGLDLGPNLAVRGSLSALFWLQVARATEARPSIVRYSLLGAALMPATLVASLLVTAKL